MRKGTVNAGVGENADVLFVNGSAGEGRRRRVFVDRGDEVVIRVDSPPAASTGEPSPFVLWIWPGAPSSHTLTRLPDGLGFIGMPTPLTRARGPQPIRIANNLGFPRALGRELWPGTPTQPAPTVLPRGPRMEGHVLYLQGIIADPGAPNGAHAVTNGIEIRPRP